MDISDIESWVDGTSPQPKRQVKRKPFAKRTKYTAVLLALLLIGGVTGFGAIYTFFVQQTTDVTLADTSLLEWDETPAEDLAVDEDITGVGGDDFTYIHWLNLSSESDNDLEVDFTWSGNITVDGIYCNITYWDTDHWEPLCDNDATLNNQYTLSPGDNLKCQTYYLLDEKIEYRTDYQVILTID